MTDLTEQWKKGELPEGHYYVKDGGNVIAEYFDGYFYSDGLPMTSFYGGVDEVLEPVPSYEEWQELKASYEMSKNANLEQATWMVDMEKENTELKGLLKSALSWLPDGSKLRGLRYAQIQNLKRKIKEKIYGKNTD